MNRPPAIKVGLPPVVRSDARLLVLGSLPGERSLAARRYYAHPGNQFWRLLGPAIGADLAGLDYDQRLGLLLDRGVALWDVVASASRTGSLDQAIRGASPNALAELVAKLTNLRAIAFNGATAARIGRSVLAPGGPVALIDLPSSSAANTRPLADKAAAWAQLGKFVAGPAPG